MNQLRISFTIYTFELVFTLELWKKQHKGQSHCRISWIFGTLAPGTSNKTAVNILFHIMNRLH